MGPMRIGCASIMRGAAPVLHGAQGLDGRAEPLVMHFIIFFLAMPNSLMVAASLGER